MSSSRASEAGPAAVSRGPALLVLGVALLACVGAVVIGGAAAPLLDGTYDPGATVRWGLPLVRVVQDLSAAMTIGLLVVGALLVPGRAPGRSLLTASRYAVGSGVVWVASELVGVILGFADAAGLTLSDPDLWAQFQQYVWTLETLRVALIGAALAAVATTIAAVSLQRKGIATAAVVSVAAVLPLALAGHAAGAADHESAVNTLAAHLVGASLWVGGLLALVLLRPSLDRALPVVVGRFSTLALWCFVAVAVSGVVSAMIRLGSLANLATAYGVLVLVKSACLVALGAFGWQQRSRVVARLRSDPTRGRLFARLAATETLVMGVAVGFATALARTAPPAGDTRLPGGPAYQLTGWPEPAAPTSSTWLTLWRFDWLWGVVALLAVGVYVSWAWRLHRRGDHWPVGRVISWVLGWAVLAWATCGAPGVLGRVSFSWHMVEHMTIAMYAPVLLVLGAPISLALRALPARGDGSLGPRELLLGMVHSRVLRVVGNPVVAAVLFFSSLVVFYYSPLFALALTTHTGHVLMVLHFLVTGYLFAWVLVGRDPGPPKWAPSLRLLILLITVSFHAFFGVALMSGTTLLAPDFFTAVRVSWIPDPIADQQLGGSIAWAVGELPVLLLSLVVVRDWIRSDGKESRRHDRRADRDGDADLVAYNARLQELSRRTPDGPRVP